MARGLAIDDGDLESAPQRMQRAEEPDDARADDDDACHRSAPMPQQNGSAAQTAAAHGLQLYRNFGRIVSGDLTLPRA